MNNCNSDTCPFNYEQFGCVLMDKLDNEILPCNWEI